MLAFVTTDPLSPNNLDELLMGGFLNGVGIGTGEEVFGALDVGLLEVPNAPVLGRVVDTRVGLGLGVEGGLPISGFIIGGVIVRRQ